MNVINKLKSKKNKQGSTQVNLPPSQPLSKETDSSNSITNIAFKPIFSSLEPLIYSNVSEKSSNLEDMDEVNIDEYYQRKDRHLKMINKLQSSQTFQEDLKQNYYSLQVKKSYNVGDISVFEGNLARKIKGIQTSQGKVKLSCSQEVIQFPQTIHKITLSKVILLTSEQGIFIGDDVVKLAQKKYQK